MMQTLASILGLFILAALIAWVIAWALHKLSDDDSFYE